MSVEIRTEDSAKVAAQLARHVSKARALPKGWRFDREGAAYAEPGRNCRDPFRRAMGSVPADIVQALDLPRVSGWREVEDRLIAILEGRDHERVTCVDEANVLEWIARQLRATRDMPANVRIKKSDLDVRTFLKTLKFADHLATPQTTRLLSLPDGSTHSVAANVLASYLRG